MPVWLIVWLQYDMNPKANGDASEYLRMKIAYIIWWQSCSSCSCSWVGETSKPWAGRLKSSRRSCKRFFFFPTICHSNQHKDLRILSIRPSTILRKIFYLLAEVSGLFFVLSCSSKQAPLVYLNHDMTYELILNMDLTFLVPKYEVEKMNMVTCFL